MKKYLLVVLAMNLILIANIAVYKYRTSDSNSSYKPISPTNTPTQLPTPTVHTFSERKLWNLVNEWQTSQGFKPYIEDSRLCTLAQTRLTEIKTNWSHEGFWSHNNDFPHNGLAENLSRNWFTEEDTLQGWLDSPTHRKNLTDYYAYSCLRCEDNTCVHEFANFGSVQGASTTVPTVTPVPHTYYEATSERVYDTIILSPLPTFIPYPSLIKYQATVIPTYPPIATIKPPEPINGNIQFHTTPTTGVPYGFSN